MANEISLFKSGSVIPAYLRGALDETTKSLMGGGNLKRISIEGGVYRMMVNGQEISKNTSRSMNVIFISAAEANSRTFYSGVYVKGAKDMPACWSNDGVKPDDKSKEKQASHCATCPKNIKGSGSTPDSRACRFNRRAAIALENDIEGGVYAISFPAASIFDNTAGKMGLQSYSRYLGGHGVNVNAVVTEMTFDTDASTPKIIFTAVRALELDEFNAICALKDHPDTINAITMNVSEIDNLKGEAPVERPAVQSEPQAKPAPSAAAKPRPKPTVESVVSDDVPEPIKREVSQTKVADISATLSDWADADD